MADTIICPACFYKRNAAAEICPACGMRKIHVPGTSEEAQRVQIQYGQQWRTKCLESVEVGVNAIQWREEGDYYVEDGRIYVKLQDAANLKLSETVWNDKKFGQGDSEEPVSVNVVIRKGDQKTEKVLKSQKLNLKDFWHVGITLKEGFQVSLSVGNEKTHVDTDSVSLMMK